MKINKRNDSHFMIWLSKQELEEMRRGLEVAWGEGQTYNRELNQNMIYELYNFMNDNDEMKIFYQTYNKE